MKYTPAIDVYLMGRASLTGMYPLGVRFLGALLYERTSLRRGSLLEACIS
jgi:hypothetical protein